MRCLPLGQVTTNSSAPSLQKPKEQVLRRDGHRIRAGLSGPPKMRSSPMKPGTTPYSIELDRRTLFMFSPGFISTMPVLSNENAPAIWRGTRVRKRDLENNCIAGIPQDFSLADDYGPAAGNDGGHIRDPLPLGSFRRLVRSRRTPAWSKWLTHPLADQNTAATVGVSTTASPLKANSRP